VGAAVRPGRWLAARLDAIGGWQLAGINRVNAGSR
jgi:hypothetical protein